MTVITTASNYLTNSQVEERIDALIPPELNGDKAFLNFRMAIHTVDYMENATGSLKRYMKFRGVTSCEKLVKEKRKAIEEHVTSFLNEGCKHIINNSKRVIFSHIKLFYIQNDVILNWAKLAKRIGRREKNTNRAYTREEVEAMYQHADHRGKAVILLMASTGLRIGGIPSLNIGDLRPVAYQGQKMYAITVYRGEPEEYIDFCTPECARVIDNYLNFRRSIMEPLGQASPLIRNAADAKTATNNPDNRLAKRMERDGIRGIIEKAVIGSGVKAKLAKSGGMKGGTRYEAHMTRGFRKFYYNALVKSKMQALHREVLIGHKDGIANIEASHLAMVYGAPEESELFVSYVTAIEHLTIDQSESLTRKNEELKDQLQEAIVSRKEFENLKAELFREMDARSGITRPRTTNWRRLIEYDDWRNETWTPEEKEGEEKKLERFMEEQDGEARAIREQEEV